MTTSIQLANVQSYCNASVLQFYQRECPGVSRDAAQQIFQDLLGWLWLSDVRLQSQLTTHMIAPLTHLDKMWHCFILHTEAYTEFCHHYFKRYLHHVVSTDEYVMSTDELTAYLSDCYDHLGEGWILRNFSF